MSNRETNLHWEDAFDRNDAASVGNNWTTVGDMRISQELARQGSSAATVGKILRNVPETIGPDYEVQASMSIDDDTVAGGSASGFIVLRGTPSAAATVSQSYSVGLKMASDVYTLIIRKEDDTETDVATLTLTASQLNLDSSDSPLGIAQVLRARIWNTDDYVQIEVDLNDEASPTLSYQDYGLPQWRREGQFGFIFNEGDVATNVALNYISIQSLFRQDGVEENLGNRTAGDLIDSVMTMAVRDSANQVDRSRFRQFVNNALQELATYLGKQYFWEDLHTWMWKPTQSSYELPPDTLDIADVIWDNASQTPYGIHSERLFRQVTGNETTATPSFFRREGIGPGGGPTLRAYSIPDGNRSYTIQRWRRPRFMVNDNDVPDIPQQFVWALEWGALVYYISRDGSRRDRWHAKQEWLDAKKTIRQQLRRSMAESTNFIPRSGMQGARLGFYNEVAFAKFGINRR
jgi:hypothetical protein